MLDILRRKFPVEYNKYVAIELGVSIRSAIRKARELGIQKELKFFEYRRMDISARAQAAKSPNIHKGEKGWCVPNSQNTRFLPGHVSPMNNPVIAEKARQSRNNTIANEKILISIDLPQLTKLKLTNLK